MKILIIGCGKVGSALAMSLAKDNNDVVCCDTRSDRVEKITSTTDSMGVVGNGVLPQVLKEAGVETCDYMIACTSDDEKNILSCLMARRLSKCKTIARVRSLEYADQTDYIMSELDITMTINPDQATANEISRIIRYNKSISSDSFFKGRLNLLKIQVDENSKLPGIKLYDVEKKFNCKVLVCVIERGDEVIIPHGNDIIEAGDKISFVSDNVNTDIFFTAIGYNYKPIRSYMIIGGSRIAEYLIKNIRQNNQDATIKVIDTDRNTCEKIAEEFDDVAVINGDGQDTDLLLREGIQDVDSFISLTGIDEENIIFALYAKKVSNAKVIAKVNKMNYIETLKEIDVGSIINPERIAANIIDLHIRGANQSNSSKVETLYKICDDKAEALSFRIREKSKVTNITLKELKLKPNVLIAGIYRKGKVIIPKGNDEILVHDSVLVINQGDAIHDIEDIVEV